MQKPKSSLIKAGNMFIVLGLLSSLLVILNTFYIQSVVVHYIGIFGIGLTTGYVLFLTTTCITYFVKGFRDMINNGWFG